MKLIPTQEQQDIVQAVTDGKSIKVSASAGSSKTTTLVMVAEALVRPMLYLTFNKAMADEAKEKFPGWVEVRTTHSLAYQAIGYKYQEKLKRPMGAYVNVCGTASEVAKFFKIRPMEYLEGKWITSAAIGYAVISTVKAFECSDDSKIDSSHVSMYALSTKRRESFGKDFIREYCAVVLKNAKALWELRTNLKSKVLAEHDTYLKLYQLSKPDLSNYDVLMVDEFQDTNMCVVDIVKRQKGQVVIVGDPSQAIYQFRGAINALDNFDYPAYSLSKSFRFGQAIADLGVAITGRQGMLGWEKLDTQVKSVADDCEFPEKYTAIYRTNTGMLLDAVQAISEGKTVNIISDIRDFTALIDSALALKAGDKKGVKHSSLLVYDTWNELVADVDWASGELQRVVDMIKDNSVFRILGLLKSHRNTDNPDVTFLTAHKSKGLEYDNVVLGGDFPSIYDNKGAKRELPIAETNLMYVAATRAKQKLYTCAELEERVLEHKYEISVNDMYLLSGEAGLSFVDEIEEKHVADFAKMCNDDPNFDDSLQMAVEDGFDTNNLPLSVMLMPSV